jgi:hypothetical protein
MDSKKMSEVNQEAKRLSGSELEKEQKKYKKVTVNIAAILSVAAILLLIILYAYSTGYYKVFNVPPSYFNLDLKLYLPVALQACAVFLLSSYYYASRKKDKAFKRNRIDLLRVFWVAWAMDIIFSLNNINGILYKVIACSVAIVFELVIYIRGMPKEDKIISGSIYHLKLEDMVEREFLHSLYKRGYTIIIILIVLVAPYWGKMKAEHKMDYETVQLENKNYVIIVDYRDAVVMQPCSIIDDTLVIDTTQYLYKNKNDMVISYKKYNCVVIE